jgi:hypothetical protein
MGASVAQGKEELSLHVSAGDITLVDLFKQHRQLFIKHFMMVTPHWDRHGMLLVLQGSNYKR